MAKVTRLNLHWWAALCGTLLVAAGGFGALGRLCGLPALYAWHSPRLGMLVDTNIVLIACGTTVLAVNILIHNWRDDQEVR